MKITVHDTPALLEPLFCEPSAPKERLERARPIFYDESSLFRRFELVKRSQHSLLFKVMQAGALGGYSVASAQQGWGLFNPTRTLAASQWTFARFREEAILIRIRDALEAVTPPLSKTHLNTLDVFLLPGDPANRTFMLRSHGLSVFGGVPGLLLVQLWPSEGNLARLESLLLRSLFHTTAEPPSTLGNVLELEKRVAEMAEQHYPAVSVPRLLAFTAPKNWQADLAHAARLCGADAYDDVRANIYGADGSSIAPLPVPVPLSAEEIEYARAVLKEGSAEAQASRIAAYLYGDEVVAPQGHAGVGMPLFGGLTVLR